MPSCPSFLLGSLLEPAPCKKTTINTHPPIPTCVPQVDTSGFALTTSSSLRPSNLGVLTLGSYDLRIPAQQDSYQVGARALGGA